MIRISKRGPGGLARELVASRGFGDDPVNVAVIALHGGAEVRRAGINLTDYQARELRDELSRLIGDEPMPEWERELLRSAVVPSVADRIAAYNAVTRRITESLVANPDAEVEFVLTGTRTATR